MRSWTLLIATFMQSLLGAIYRPYLWIVAGLLVTSGLYAGEAVERNAPFMRLSKAGAEWRLEVRQAVPDAVFDYLGRSGGVRIHAAKTSAALLTATCEGATLRRIVECLLGPSANLAFRYPPERSTAGTQPSPTEIWVLAAGPSAADGLDTQHAPDAGEPDKVLRFLEMLGASDATQRASALSGLALLGDPGNSRIHQALTGALSDADANVRAQAVSALARRDGAQAAEFLRAALYDNDATVRLMAVDHAGSDSALLQAALADSDETVRALAALKLAVTH
ncbi:MAG: hypothetical protein EPN21_13705 [Methylococcaceae bacterium]|nr:MAG: hypothetical protein EPN21_13705 [Methylococcaceae bacterium]